MQSHSRNKTSVNLAHLESNTFVDQIVFREELASTNDLALELCSESENPGTTLVLAERQTSGRGRGANKWWSNQGALTFSLILDATNLSLSQERWPLISLTAGLAVGDVLESLTAESNVGLKWPNDVFLKSRKVCGILVEVPPHTQGKIVVGIGLNVNNSFASAPTELQSIATSLIDATQKSHDRTDVLTRLLTQIEQELAALKTQTLNLPDRWHPRCVLRHKTVHLQMGNRKLVGVCQGINSQGALILETETGTETCFGGTIEKFE